MSNAAALAPTLNPILDRAGSNAGMTATGITKSYKRGVWSRRREVHVLRGADLTVGAGEVVGLVSENGSGQERSV